MKQIKLLHTTGKRDIKELDFKLPSMKSNSIEVKTWACGVCRSDVAAYAGWEDPMPLGMQGHEGLGVVTKVGKNVKSHVKVGDYVSTWSDPAYGDYYYAQEGQFVVVPELKPKYILQPTACAMNIILKTLEHIQLSKIHDIEILIIGSGFMSLIIGQFLNSKNIKYVVCGASHKKHWKKLNKKLIKMDALIKKNKKWQYIIDLSSNGDNFHHIANILGDLEALVCYAATPFKPVTTNFFKSCWNCHTFIMPSPRNKDFNYIMDITKDTIKNKKINPEEFWSQGYNRKNMLDVKLAFEDGVERPKDYLRGYICWDV